MIHFNEAFQHKKPIHISKSDVPMHIFFVCFLKEKSNLLIRR